MFVYVYILRSKKDNNWYTGSTNDLQRRFRDHNNGRVAATSARRPLTLVYYEACRDDHDARKREKYLKSGMGKRYLKNRLANDLAVE